jgi:hypothetical protein
VNFTIKFETFIRENSGQESQIIEREKCLKASTVRAEICLEILHHCSKAKKYKNADGQQRKQQLFVLPKNQKIYDIKRIYCA